MINDEHDYQTKISIKSKNGKSIHYFSAKKFKENECR